jgi:hypothetical protein
MAHLSCGNRPLARCPNQPCCGGLDREGGTAGLSQSFSDQRASCVRRRRDLTFGYGLGFQTAKIPSKVGSEQVPQSAIIFRIVCGKTLRQARGRYPGPGPTPAVPLRCLPEAGRVCSGDAGPAVVVGELILLVALSLLVAKTLIQHLARRTGSRRCACGWRANRCRRSPGNHVRCTR